MAVPVMAAYEWVAIGYFAGLSLAAWAARVPWRRRLMVSATALGAAAAVAAVAAAGGTSLRAWVPHIYLVGGYWLPARLAAHSAAATGFERWLVRTDAWFRRLPAIPAPLTHVTELAYLLCYPLVPAGFLVVWLRGDDVDVVRFWVAVLVAGLACYVSLPWLVSRPPRLCEPSALPVNQIGALNAFTLRRVSHELNTFPSGHVAVSCAAAAMVGMVSPAAAFVIGAIAVVIAVGAVAGHYHYVVDVALGFVVAATAVAAGVLA
jgi:membrane-associated phospholipid phosphatase